MYGENENFDKIRLIERTVLACKNNVNAILRKSLSGEILRTQ
jgi:hypothetical protein